MDASKTPRRVLTIRLRSSVPSPEDCLRMLDIPHSPESSAPGLDFSNLSRTTESPARRAPLLDDPGTQSPLRPDRPELARSNPSSGSAEDEPHFAGGREWKLSARLDRELLAELYGAAAQLSERGATVSSMVEEALRSFLPQLRRRFNRDQPFAKRGPKLRSPQRRELLRETSKAATSSPESNRWVRLPASPLKSNQENVKDSDSHGGSEHLLRPR